MGMSTLLLNLPFAPCAKWVDNQWLASFWKFAFQTKSIFNSNMHAWTPCPSREYDEPLVDLALWYHFQPKHIQDIYSSRLYLQVYSIAAITSAVGASLLPSAYHSNCSLDCISSYAWPNSERPSAPAWSQWKLFIQHFSRALKLLQPLRN